MYGVFGAACAPALLYAAHEERCIHALLQSMAHRISGFRLLPAQPVPNHLRYGLYLLRRACRLRGGADCLRRSGRIDLRLLYHAAQHRFCLVVSVFQLFQHQQKPASRSVDLMHGRRDRLLHCMCSLHGCALVPHTQMMQGGKQRVFLHLVQQMRPSKARFRGQIILTAPAVDLCIKQMEQICQQRCGSIQPICITGIMEHHALQPCRPCAMFYAFRPVTGRGKVKQR